MTQNNSPIERISARFIAGFAQGSQFETWWKPEQPAIGLAMIGRSNVGKSTLINKLFRQGLARTSKTPGKTKEINVFEFSLQSDLQKKFYVYDLPGHGHAQVSHEQKKVWDQLLGTFFPLVSRWCLGVVIQDSRHLSGQSDLEFLNYINQSTMEIVLVANKIDGLKNQKEKHQFKQDFLTLSKNPRWSAVFQCSQDRPDLQDTLANYLSSFCLRKAMARHHLADGI